MKLHKDILYLLRANAPRVFTFQQIFFKLGMEHVSMDEMEHALELLLKQKKIGTMTGLDEVRVYQFNDGSYCAGGFKR
ncbi:MAG TPA: hypothetical protein VGQ99_08270 [Tepidisphaeraceae bacterium]|nr:hypothetical protein [Tepidisphaeraceae bacterium]